MLKLAASLPSTASSAGGAAADGIQGIAGLFTDGQGGAWFDPSDSSTVFSNTGGTTAAEFGGKIARINDKSGNSNHLVQATSSRQPIYGRQPTDGLRILNNYNNKINDLDGAGMDSNFTSTYSRPSGVSKPFTSNLDVFLAVENNNANYGGITLSGIVPTSTNLTFQGYFKEYTGGGDSNGVAVVLGNGNVVYMQFSDGATTLTGSEVTSHSASEVGSTGWYHVVIKFNTNTANTTTSIVNTKNNSLAGIAEGSGFYFFGLSLEEGSTANTLQIRGANEHDVVPHNSTTSHKYIACSNATGLGTSGTMSLGSVDRVSVFTTVSADEDVQGVILENRDDNSTNHYSLGYNATADQFYGIAGSSITNRAIIYSSAQTIPSKKVVSLVTDISDDDTKLYIDGVASSSTSELGTGDFSDSVQLNVGCRDADNSSSTFSNSFRGKIYQLAFSGDKVTSAADLSTLHTIFGSKAGITL